jgi:hypothetical protein
MKRQDRAADAAERNEPARDEGDAAADGGLEGAGPAGDVDAAVGSGDVDLDDLDAVIDPDLVEDGGWDPSDLDAELELDQVDEDQDEVFDDEAEIRMLHELGIDLDAPDGATGLDLTLGLDQDDPADDGVAA